MEVTVKTLDSQTKSLQVPIEITVKEFKEKIAEEMGIPTEKQRLIFQGKVLQDDKPLQEYKVDGCVVHLVEKQPPRSSRSNGQSTETSTSSTSTTSSGNVVMGAFALPVDVMGVTQQIVQGIIQQIGAESAQANISTSSSDDGSSVNVHINLSTVMSRNDARSRIAPARVHLNNVSNIVSRLQNDGMLPNNNMDEDTSSSESSNPQNGSENNSESTPEDLASILEEVVRLNDEIRPHLLRYQELLRATPRQLNPGDDLLPDLTAEALHSLSHAYHALSDLTTNLCMPEPRLNLLPSLSPIPAPAAHAHARTFPPTMQSQESSRGATGPTSVTSTGSGASTGLSGSAVISGSGGISASGILSGGCPLNIGGNSTGTASTPATGTGNGESRPRPHNHHPFLGFPMSLRNLPNLAVQFNPAAGNITIAHIVTTAVDGDSLRATTTTTNSTPTPRTSSRGSAPVPSQPNPTEGETPHSREPVDDSTSVSTDPTSTPSGVTSSDVTSSGVTSSEDGGQSTARSSGDSNAVLNFHPRQSGSRDPLLPCQSFHFGSPVQQPNGLSSAGLLGVPVAGNATQQQGQQREGQLSSSGTTPIPVFHTATVPSPAVLQQLLHIGQRAAAEAASAGGSENPFIEFFVPPSSNVPQPFGSGDRSNDALRDFAALMAERQRTMTPEQRASRNAQSAASQETAGTLSRFLHRVSETFPMQQLMLSAFGGTVEPYTLTRTMTVQFLRDDILSGAEPTSENLQRATEQILEELQKTFEATFAECNVKEAIDAPATLLTYLRPKIRRLLELVNSTEDDETYALEMNLLLSRASVELIALTEYCLEDGMHGMEVALRSSMSHSSAITVLDPGLRGMTVDTTWACIRDLRDSVRLNDTFLLPFVVRKEKRKNGAKKTTPSPKMQKKEINKEETNEKIPASAGASNAGNTSESSRTSNTSSKPKDVPMETDEEWKKVIPAEWVPVISQDIIRQRRLPRQAPFSDGYINGMPPKRRKIMEEPAPYSQCVSATLKRSIAKAGVTPRTDVEKVNKEASSSLMLEKVFEQEVKKEVRERLSNDTDYNSEKFPSIHNYFEKENGH